MGVEIVTKEDLQIFKQQLLREIKTLLEESVSHNQQVDVKGYKTADVRKILGCCYNTLTALRIKKKIRAKKVLGTWYYNTDDVRKLLEEGF